jgi:hypothetical protein
MPDQPELIHVEPEYPGLPYRMIAMLKMYGDGPDGAKCKTCIHLERHRWGSYWLKCGLQRPTGPAGDWQARWPACGKWEFNPDAP